MRAHRGVVNDLLIYEISLVDMLESGVERHKGGKAIRMWVTSSLRSAFLSALSEANVQLSSTLYLDAYRRAFLSSRPLPLSVRLLFGFRLRGCARKGDFFIYTKRFHD